MTTQNLALFKGFGAKMQYLNTRQRVISQNIANADTPGYRAKDVKGANFEAILTKIEGKTRNKSSVRPAATNEGHLSAGQKSNLKTKNQRMTYEVAPAGNAVIMEEQMIKSQETTMDYTLMTNLYRKNVGMIYTALGRN